MNCRIFRRPGPLSLALALLVFSTAATTAEANDTIAPPPRETLQADILQHRVDEARTKARLMERAAQLQRPETANQDQYDAKYYNLTLDVNPTAHILSGVVAATARVVTGPISTMDLDLKANMTVSAVTAGGVASTFSRAGDVLTVNLDRSYAAGESFTVTVTYSGNPAGDSFGWSTAFGRTMIWTLSEPFGARDWWPCKDQNHDKPDSVDVACTVPDIFLVASNGKLVSDVDNGPTRTVHWHERNPIATYLVSLSIYPYMVFSDSYTPLAGGSPMELRFYVYPEHYSAVQPTYALVAPMIHAYASAWGEYPWIEEKFGHAEFTWGGGMEHQTISSLGGYGEDLISHELAHQWWGDMITCDDFHHVWLNEGFATWAEAYWKEVTQGISVYHEYMDAAAYYGQGTIYVEDLSDFNAIFDSDLSYNKASWVLHMLRGIMGDTDFFAGLRHYRALHERGTATTEQFRDAMEDVSGIDLHPFFQQWIYGEYFPIYQVAWNPTQGGINLTINQVQTNTGLFTMPIDVRVQSTAGTYDFVVQNAAATENYSLAVPGTIQNVQLDPDRWILRNVQTTVVNPTFDRGILLVNGVDWASYGTEITSAYADSAFWGTNPITFWDTFPEPAGGYPSSLPAPLGHGSVPGGTLGQYSTVIWVGNNFNGDLADWAETPIASYLAVGGDVLLITRMGSSFMDTGLTSYLGITWTGTGLTLSNCTAQVAGLVNMGFTGTQSANDVFSTTVGPNSTLLFRDSSTGNRGTGVIVEPPGGGTNRPDGGRLVFISGRGYRFSHSPLRSNVTYILSHYFHEPYQPSTAVPEPAGAAAFSLAPNRPNPFFDETVIPFSLGQEGVVELSIYDVTGRCVRSLASGRQAGGEHSITWDARDARGARVAPGIYYLRLKADRSAATRPVVVLH